MWQMKSGMFLVNTIWFHFQIFGGTSATEACGWLVYPQSPLVIEGMMACKLLYIIKACLILHSLALVLVKNLTFTTFQIHVQFYCNLCITYCYNWWLVIYSILFDILWHLDNDFFKKEEKFCCKLCCLWTKTGGRHRDLTVIFNVNGLRKFLVRVEPCLTHKWHFLFMYMQ